jgi:hypothetical protein
MCYHCVMEDNQQTQAGGSMPPPAGASDSVREHAAPTVQLPAPAYSLSLAQVGQLFVEAGIGRSRRRLAELCQNGTIDAKKLHTTSGPTWFASEVSVTAAIQQIKSDEALAVAASASMPSHADAGDSMRETEPPLGENSIALPAMPTPSAQPIDRAKAGDSMQQHAPAGMTAGERELYERLLRDKDHRIEEQGKRIDFLESEVSKRDDTGIREIAGSMLDTLKSIAIAQRLPAPAHTAPPTHVNAREFQSDQGRSK